MQLLTVVELKNFVILGPPTEKFLASPLGATNRPQELDEATRRRLTKRLYIPLPTTGPQ